MRRDASSAIGNLVGIAVSGLMAAGYPGEPARPSGDEARKRWNDERLSRFAGYLRSLGRTGDAEWVTSEAAAGREARDIIRDGARHVQSSRVRTYWLKSRSASLRLAFLAARRLLVRLPRPRDITRPGLGRLRIVLKPLPHPPILITQTC